MKGWRERDGGDYEDYMYTALLLGSTFCIT